MKIARHWIRETQRFPWRGGQGETGAWGWSQHSVEEARQRSREATTRVIDWLLGRTDSIENAGYDYLHRPAREEVVRELPRPRSSADAEPDAFVSRNSYGALILNAQRLFIGDLDLRHVPRSSQDGFFRRLFSKRTPAPSALERLCGEVRSWSSTHPNVGLRLYRTAGGLRVLVASEPVEAATERSDQWLEELSNDRFYRQLCRVQECYRARLTPKPWRIGTRPPNARFPFDTDEGMAEHRAWVARYEASAKGFATCQLLEQLAPPNVHPELAGLVALHDAETRATQSLELA